jgi:hypothetical protein
MNLTHNTTGANMPNRNYFTRIALWLALTVSLLAPVFAHEGFEHVMGTVAKITGKILTVKTAKGDVDVTLDEKTAFTNNGQKGGMADLKIGLRVIVDIPEGAKVKVAHSVKIGVAVPVSHDAH